MTRTDDARARIEATTERARSWASALRERLVAVDLAADAFSRFKEADGSVLAGYLAYRLFLLLLPLAVIIVALSGYSSSASADASEHLRLGRTLADSISQAGQDAHASRFPLLLSGLVAFAVAAWGLLGGLQICAARAWRIPIAKFPAKGRAFVRLCGSLLLFGLVLYLSALVRKLGVLAGLAGSLAGLFSMGVAFFGLAWILPRRCKEWYWLLPGTAAGAAGTAGLQAFATFYLPEKLAGASQTYGTLGTTLTFLSFLFLLGALFMVTVVVNAVVFERYQHDPPGLLRRVAAMVPALEVKVGSGYVPEGGAAERPTILGGRDDA